MSGLLHSSGIQSDLDRQLVEEKRALIVEMMGEKVAFIFGKQGCLTDMELHTTLKVKTSAHQGDFWLKMSIYV